MRQLTAKEINFLQRAAKSFNQTTKIEFDDLFQEAALQYCELIKNKPEKIIDKTFVYACIRNKLINFVKKEIKNENLYLEEVNQVLTKTINPKYFFEFYNSLSKSLKQITNLVLFSDKIQELPPRLARGLIRKELKEKYHWKKQEIDSGINNMKKVVSETV